MEIIRGSLGKKRWLRVVMALTKPSASKEKVFKLGEIREKATKRWWYNLKSRKLLSKINRLGKPRKRHTIINGRNRRFFDKYLLG